MDVHRDIEVNKIEKQQGVKFSLNKASEPV